jgi:hypothetical protein
MWKQYNQLLTIQMNMRPHARIQIGLYGSHHVIHHAHTIDKGNSLWIVIQVIADAVDMSAPGDVVPLHPRGHRQEGDELLVWKHVHSMGHAH